MVLGIYIVVGIINMLAMINDYNIPNTPELRDIRVRRSNFEPYALRHRAHNSNVDVKRIFNGDYFKERVKRNYPVYPQTGYLQQVNTSWGYPGFYPGYFNGNVMNTSGPSGYNAALRNNYSAGSYNPGNQYTGYSPYPGNYTNSGYQYPMYIPYTNNTYPGYSAYPGYAPYSNTYPGYNLNPGNNSYPGFSSNSNYKSNTYSPYASPGYRDSGYPIPVATPGYKATSVTSTTPRIEKSCIICNIGCPQFMKKIGLFCVQDDDYN